MAGKHAPVVRRTCPCGNRCARGKKICNLCLANPRLKDKAWRALYNERQQEKVDAMAEKETAKLSKKSVLTPLDGEAIVLKWLRGE